MAEAEIWKPIERFNGRYMVSNLGRVKSLEQVVMKRTRSGGIARQVYPEKILTVVPVKGGYLRYNLGGKARCRTYSAHRLVLEAFIGPCPEGMEGCHNDGNAGNNRLSNLRWDTHLSNNGDRKRHGRYAVGSAHHMAKLSEDMAREIALDPRHTDIIMAEYGISRHMVCAIKNGSAWGHLDVNRVPALGRTLERTPWGESHKLSKLKAKDVLSIRVDTRPQRDIAAEYGVNQATVSAIKIRKTWRHL